MKTQEMAANGYHKAIAAYRAIWTRRQHTNPKVQAAAERQLREPEGHFAVGRKVLEELRAEATAQQRVRPSDASRARALQRLAAECTGLATIIPAPAPAPAAPRRAANVTNSALPVYQ
ncbi:hypothetical protein ACIOJ9_34845 [Streptomyces sp. NPDC088175]|uniref:hypothetical protein n=1 Tax=unclassified Streptomyces TaxID=2593676 RepID=UPI003815C28F